MDKQNDEAREVLICDAELLPPHQRRHALHALLGDSPSQRIVLELTVRLAEAGIEPIPIFKRAALAALKTSLATDNLPSLKRRGGQRKGPDGAQFQLAVDYWEEVFIHGKRGAGKRAALKRMRTDGIAEIEIESEEKKYAKYVSEAVARCGDIAKAKALLRLALGDKSGQNMTWWRKFEKFSEQLQHEVVDAIGRLPKDEVFTYESTFHT